MLEILAVAPREGTMKIMVQSLGIESVPLIDDMQVQLRRTRRDASVHVDAFIRQHTVNRCQISFVSFV